MGTEGSLADVNRPGGEVDHHLVTSLRTGGTVPPLPHTPSRRVVTTTNLSLISQVTVNRTVFSGNLWFRSSVSGILQLHFLCSVTNKHNSDNFKLLLLLLSSASFYETGTRYIIIIIFFFRVNHG
jgi:hypothetical protein